MDDKTHAQRISDAREQLNNALKEARRDGLITIVHVIEDDVGVAAIAVTAEALRLIDSE